ncbi:MAG: hypothetical protein MSG64_12385 [Pyrinomonadaceae bacterium MAG19_C2-C3]|nr:hypothetical protein [Pyrinomonadaceae bacterium MAG19_C2-C3]
MLRRYMHARERRLATLDDDSRQVRPFEWGASFIQDAMPAHDEHASPAALFDLHATHAVEHSDDYFHLPPVRDYKLDAHHRLTWTSAIETPSPVNNTAHAQFFPPAARQTSHTRHASRPRRAVVLLPQWNAQPDSHIALSKLLARFGIAALRVTLPYHEMRRPPELTRADYLIGSNVGRTIQSVRQAALDARAAVRWLAAEGFERIGILGTSIGSCAAFLTFVHEPLINVGVFNHVSGYFADVVWNGISTRHVRESFEPHLTLEDLRRYWLPISPLAYIEHLSRLNPRPMRFIAARYDLTFPVDLSRHVICEIHRRHIPLDVAWLPCGHYTLGETPWKYLDGYKIVSFFRRKL